MSIRNLTRTVPTSLARRAVTPIGPIRLASTAATPAPGPSATSAQGTALSETPLRLQAIKLYKELHRLGRDYPDPNYGFNKRLRRAFEKNAKCEDPVKLKESLALGEHVKKEVLAMLSVKKFRHLRRTYYPNDGPR